MAGYTILDTMSLKTMTEGLTSFPGSTRLIQCFSLVFPTLGTPEIEQAKLIKLGIK